MNVMNTCPQCQSEIAAAAPAGLCPKCLMGLGLEMAVGLERDNDDDAIPVTKDSHSGASFTAPTPQALAACFPDLDIIELLGQGGMGAVYKAQQIKLGRHVALKILKPDSCSDPAFAERFHREARLLAKLNHPNIVAVHDFGQVTTERLPTDASLPPTLYYIVMEHVDGTNLRDGIRTPEESAETALQIIPQVCQALQYAHDEGVVHRDIKPENILIDRRGQAKLVDFGLARLVTASQHDYSLTATHQIMGTPAYMAPEQMESTRSVDHRADIYSLGVVFYELLTGDLPLGQFQPPSKKSDTDSRLDDVVLRAMAKEPDRRFQHISDLQSSVEQISAELSSAAGVSTIARREIRKAWRWVSEDPRSSKRKIGMPAMLMIGMSVAAALLILCPWVSIQIEPQTLSGNVPIELAQKAPEAILGYQLWSGIAMASFLSLLTLLISLIPTNKPLRKGQAALMTLLAVCALASAIAFRIELSQTTYAVKFPDLKNPDSDSSNESSWQMELQAIDHQQQYQRGYYASFGLAIGLVLLTSASIRQAIQRNQDPDAFKIDSPTATLRFALPTEIEITDQVEFHFTGLGYRLVEQTGNTWTFQRGKSSGLWAGLCGWDLASILTVLKVNCLTVSDDQQLVNCVWAVQSTSTWIERRDVKRLETEGDQLRSLLGGEEDQIAIQPEQPLFTWKSIAASGLTLVYLCTAMLMGMIFWRERHWFLSPVSISMIMIPSSIMIVLGIITTLTGLLGINEVHQKQGNKTSLLVSFAATMLFPLTLLGAIIGGAAFLLAEAMHFNNHVYLVAPMIWFAIGLVMIAGLWRAIESRQST